MKCIVVAAAGAADHLDLPIVSASLSSDLLRRQSSTSAKQSVIFNLISLQLQIFRRLSRIFRASATFDDLLYMFFLLFRSLPLDMLGGLALPTRRSPDLRFKFFILCYVPLPLDMHGVLSMPI
jgi:hypothetical protein